MASASPTPRREERPHWIKIHYETEKDYWWFALKRQLIINFITSLVPQGSTILEIGSGGGLLSAELQKIGFKIISTDVEPSSARYTREMGISRVFISDCGEGIPLQDASVDLIFMTDVLEHIEDDNRVLSECFRVLKSGGYILITVPAYQCLYSSWDRWNHHYRRYNKKAICSLAQRNNLSIIKITFWNIPGVPFAILRKFLDIFNPNRSYEGFPRVPKILDKVLRLIISVENYLIRKVSLPFGLSLICILRKESTCK